jgi:predicted RNA-binding protein
MYVTRPVAGVIGYGNIQTKFKQKTPLWPEEIKSNKVIWPLRFEFDISFCLSKDHWNNNKIATKELFPRAGFQSISQKTAIKVVSAFGKDNSILEGASPKIAETQAPYVENFKDQAEITHDKVKKAIFEIGSLQKYVCQEEYPFEMGKLDVVWRRIEKSVPTYVFEIQVGGDIYHALAKLKHAYDLWNSHIFLIASEEDHKKASVLLSGTFHEI